MGLILRLGLFYSAIFIGTGVSSPYFPVWLKARGLTGAEIGLLLSLPMIARIVTAPLLAVWADSFRLRRTGLLLLGAMVAALYAAMALPLGYAGWIIVWFVASSCFSTIAPLTDVLALKRAARDGFNFGWPRGIGSAAFIVGNVVVGALLVRHSPDLVLAWMVVAALATAVGARLLLPADEVHEDGPTPSFAERMGSLGDLLKDRTFMTAVLACGLIQSAHAFYYSFSTLTWKQQGIPESLTGILWAVGVTAEIVFLWFLEPWRRRMGPMRLLILGGAGAVFRWTVLAFGPPLPWLFPLQVLHTLSYAATFLASLELVARLTGPRNASAGQALNSALSGGVLAGLATVASGWLFDHVGARGYLLMTAMSAAGLLLAIRLAARSRLQAG